MMNWLIRATVIFLVLVLLTTFVYLIMQVIFFNLILGLTVLFLVMSSFLSWVFEDNNAKVD